MGYLIGVGGVALLQALFSYAIILATQGKGSFVGLGVMLMAGPGILMTATSNFWSVRAARKDPACGCVVRVFFVSLVLPALQLGLMIAVSVFRL